MSKYKIGGRINGFLLKERKVKNKKSYGLFVCPYCEEEFETRIDNIVSGHTKSCGCLTKQDDLTDKTFGRWKVIKPGSKYGYWICRCECGQEKEVYYNSLLNGRSQSCGCYRSEKASAAIKKRNALFPRIKKEKAYKETNLEKMIGKTYGELTVLGDSGERAKGGDILVLCQCSCGNIVTTTSSKLKSGHTTSCGHLSSKGEEKIIKTLLSMNIKFKTQKTFEELKSKNGVRLRFDFYLPDYNCLIEYDGEQHSGDKYRGWFTPEAKEKFKERDRMKDEYCLKNNLSLIRIPYTDFDKINEEYILNLLNGQSLVI